MSQARRIAALFTTTCLVAFTASTAARADPQGTAALTVGLAGVGAERALWDTTVFHLGVRGDVLFLRDGPRDIGLGPYAEVLTHAFDELQLGGGASLLLPVSETMPLVLSAGAYGRSGEARYGFEPGLAASIFWGSRSYNFHSSYGMAGGLLVQGRVGLGSSGESAVVIGAQLDLAILTMPVVLLVNALKPSPEVQRVE
ncbi:hypothetical protein [Chondromyces apiculatus]|uniref:Uncharacterized protein n=1 Tax=Chondromyces apiculatus DSM 436 TaxID=1192034 RepID=A0A017T300_9BACT|nr:hypothetical protein [Chondromyces apiculatus]EYF03593.1 Hypothetical protein CAP_5384 [Chondromyces apiculatus DSM 436]